MKERKWNQYRNIIEEQAVKPKPKDVAKKLYYSFFGTRKHKRKDIGYDLPIKVILILEDTTFEVVPENISQGGIGVSFHWEQELKLRVGNKLRLSISFTSSLSFVVDVEVRNILQHLDGKCVVGFRFLNPNPDFVKRLELFFKNINRED